MSTLIAILWLDADSTRGALFKYTIATGITPSMPSLSKFQSVKTTARCITFKLAFHHRTLPISIYIKCISFTLSSHIFFSSPFFFYCGFFSAGYCSRSPKWLSKLSQSYTIGFPHVIDVDQLLLPASRPDILITDMRKVI